MRGTQPHFWGGPASPGVVGLLKAVGLLRENRGPVVPSIFFVVGRSASAPPLDARGFEDIKPRTKSSPRTTMRWLYSLELRSLYMEIRYTILDGQREELFGLFPTREHAEKYAEQNFAVWRVYEIDLDDEDDIKYIGE